MTAAFSNLVVAGQGLAHAGSFSEYERLFARLVEAGLIVKHRDTTDRRYVTARITGRGLELLAELDGPVREMHRRRLGHMRPDELRQLTELLESARQGT